MRKWLLSAIILWICDNAFAQQATPLTVEKIMRDPKWIGTSPDNIFWGTDNKTLYFNWNPEKAPADSLYLTETGHTTPHKTSPAERARINARAAGSYNNSKTLLTYAFNGDIYLLQLKTGKDTRITHTNAYENNPLFSFGEQRIVYQQQLDLYSWDIATGFTEQLTSFQKGSKPDEKKEPGSKQEKWLKKQQEELLQVIKDDNENKEAKTAFIKAQEERSLRSLYMGDKTPDNIVISPDGHFVTYRLQTPAKDVHPAIVPEFVTESGFTGSISARTKVGASQGTYESFIYDRERDTVLPVPVKNIPGITDLPDYVKDYTKKDSAAPIRQVVINGPFWSDKGTHALVDIRSQDNKDRWLMLLNPATGALQLLNRQRDEAWIAGPGIGWLRGNASLGWIDENTCWYQSEQSGYSHLYTTNVITQKTIPLTAGNYEVQDAWLSRSKKNFYIVTNAVHPGQKQLYRLPAAGGKAEQLTFLKGAYEVSISPDEQWIAYRYSYSNKPWELYLQANKPGAKPIQITNKAQSDEFRAYPWRDPELITFKARDNATVYARLYTPAAAKKNGAAVIFVHGAGYLQNAHSWWSQYFREYMFHNLLADKGFTVLDIDYRGSAGYGRNWRTGIYRHMGGKDLDDEVDGAKYLAEKLGIDKTRMGIYGGSYGGFMTLMALFTTPDVFAAGAALRSVTDWAHYNHGYTSNILNEPFTDSIAYRRSSPIYFAAGLKNRLLMCHGMEDVNVHFQDIIRLTQRLIELGKHNWELAVYPVEDHAFTRPDSWTDEYSRILALFEQELL